MTPHTTHREADTTSVGLTGDLDLSNNQDVEHVIRAALADTPAGGRLVIDLTGTTFLDCSTIRVILRARNAAVAHGITYQVVGATGIVRRILQILGMDRLLTSPQAPHRSPADTPDPSRHPAGERDLRTVSR